jgi:hypothetical protein
MSNVFKNNSRFSILIENDNKRNNDVIREKDYKSLNSRENNNLKSNFNERNSKRSNIYKREQPFKEEKISYSLDQANFPELVIKRNDVIESTVSVNFLEKITTESVKVEYTCEKNDIDIPETGWMLIKNDYLNNIVKIIKPSINQKREKTENEISKDVLEALVKLHEKRTSEFIESWGYDEWERVFKFPNYDYEYFDKLDELYEEETDTENDNEDEEDYLDYTNI